MSDNSIMQKTFGELSTTELYAFLKLRTDVFYVEQKVDESELDGRDLEPTTVHYWLAEGDRVVAYLRVIEDEVAEHLDAHRLIGRVVVAADRRGEGLAQRLIAAVLDRYGHEALLLHAQRYIAGLYAKFGFEAFGDEFSEAGILHLSMYRAAHLAPR
ncbi:GNAT family N-acetyltransferase [Subtercola sp. Z020]|uniref:GNAT family N-acetyltransferase n=1 Tax=Subtercola sp. Z020 TaxID=2080582 RepID=UPI001E626484|nr:GNAT family N-acetyltransferase [Subtercola sp. Z020]